MIVSYRRNAANSWRVFGENCMSLERQFDVNHHSQTVRRTFARMTLGENLYAIKGWQSQIVRTVERERKGMVNNDRAARASLAVVTTSEFRGRLAHYIGRVRHGGDFVAIRRKGEENVYVISQADWDLLDKKIADLEDGPYDPDWKCRRGGIWAWLDLERRSARLGARIAARAEERERIAAK